MNAKGRGRRQVSQRNRPSTGKKRIPKALIIVLSVLMVAVIGLGSYAAALIYKAKNNPASMFAPQQTNSKKLATLAPSATPARTPAPEEMTGIEQGVAATPIPVDPDDYKTRWLNEGYRLNEDVITVIFVGIDVLKERGPIGYRADTIILAVMDTNTGTTTMLSIPRDTYTLIQKVDDDGTIYAHEMNRINAAFAFGQGRYKYSYQNTMEALTYLMMNIPIEYYVGFDMDGMVRIVDCVGGVSATVDANVAAAAEIPAGTYRLNGEQALAFVRARKNVGGDPARVSRQQEFVKSFLSDVKRHNPISYIPTLYDSVHYYMNTNLSAEQMAVLAVVLKDLNLNDIDTRTLPGISKTINKMSVWEYDTAAMEEIVRDLYYIQD